MIYLRQELNSLNRVESKTNTASRSTKSLPSPHDIKMVAKAIQQADTNLTERQLARLLPRPLTHIHLARIIRWLKSNEFITYHEGTIFWSSAGNAKVMKLLKESVLL